MQCELWATPIVFFSSLYNKLRGVKSEDHRTDFVLSRSRNYEYSFVILFVKLPFFSWPIILRWNFIYKMIFLKCWYYIFNDTCKYIWIHVSINLQVFSAHYIKLQNRISLWILLQVIGRIQWALYINIENCLLRYYFVKRQQYTYAEYIFGER